jgi:hypothetical protein
MTVPDDGAPPPEGAPVKAKRDRRGMARPKLNWLKLVRDSVGRAPVTMHARRPEAAAIILRCLARGLPLTTAVGLAGTNWMTWDAWCKSDENLVQLRDMAMAQADLDTIAMIEIKSGKTQDWRADQWLAQARRRDWAAPADNAGRNTLAVQVVVGAPVPEIGITPVVIRGTSYETHDTGAGMVAHAIGDTDPEIRDAEFVARNAENETREPAFGIDEDVARGGGVVDAKAYPTPLKNIIKKARRCPRCKRFECACPPKKDKPNDTKPNA